MATPPTVAVESPPPSPRFGEALRVWLHIGLLSFGGPSGQIALMHRELVERRAWLSEKAFLRALSFCMLLPGPEAQQLSIYTGWRLHGVAGALVAGTLFVLPGAVLIYGISLAYVYGGELTLMAALLSGLKPAVIAIVAAALLKIGHRTLRGIQYWLLAAAAWAGIALAGLPFPVIVLAAGIVGLFLARGRAPQKAEPADLEDRPVDAAAARRAHAAAALCLVLWLAPVIAATAVLGGDQVLSRVGLFFSKAALVSFGGAYAVLPYVADQAVHREGWLSAAQMIDGLGLAETTPGPLILVLQFVGFLAGWQDGGGDSRWLLATLAAAFTTWVTFMPGFVFILAGAPAFERRRHSPRFAAALDGVGAAVVGVMLNLALWFARGVLLPEWDQPDFAAIAIALAAFIALKRLKLEVLPVVIGAALTGLALHLLGIAG